MDNWLTAGMTPELRQQNLDYHAIISAANGALNGLFPQKDNPIFSDVILMLNNIKQQNKQPQAPQGM
jgi:hypothetical protein